MIEGDVQCRGTVRDGAHADAIHAGLGYAPHGGEVHAAAGFEQHTGGHAVAECHAGT